MVKTVLKKAWKGSFHGELHQFKPEDFLGEICSTWGPPTARGRHRRQRDAGAEGVGAAKQHEEERGGGRTPEIDGKSMGKIDGTYGTWTFLAGWWWFWIHGILVGGLEHVLFFHILAIIIRIWCSIFYMGCHPTKSIIFQRGRSTNFGEAHGPDFGESGGLLGERGRGALNGDFMLVWLVV